MNPQEGVGEELPDLERAFAKMEQYNWPANVDALKADNDALRRMVVAFLMPLASPGVREEDMAKVGVADLGSILDCIKEEHVDMVRALSAESSEIICTNCEESCLDFRQRGDERICIACVGDEADRIASLGELQRLAHQTAVEKGWWPRDHRASFDALSPEKSLACLALIHSEVSEAVECVRAGDVREHERADGKPEGLPSELADIVIRTLDLAGALGIDIEAAVLRKMAFNKGRQHRHGGKLA